MIALIKRISGAREAFVLHTDHTSYIIQIADSGHPLHLYYGRRIDIGEESELHALIERREFEIGNSIAYSEKYPTVMLEDMCLEMSAFGHGDIREPFIELVKPDGSRSCDFLYDSAVIDDKQPPLKDLPCSYSESGKGEHLCLTLRDGDLQLALHYYVYPECDVITRYAQLKNDGTESIELLRLLSNQLDLFGAGWSVTTFRGAWTREMNKFTVNLPAGKIVNESRTGCSSNRANPFFMVHAADATESSGDVYGFNLVYSGNHYAAVEVSAYEKTRIVDGIQPQGSCFSIGSGESFETPEAVMTYSADGFTGQSVNMHRFVREHIVRGEWKHKERPVLLNSWEASYFDISERSLTALGKAAKELGVELLVMDDGWFGERNDDTSSLGDWDVNPKKLPGGLSGLCEKINDIGLDFGVWVEPEMINTKSRLYEAHPDWAMAIPGQLHSEGRHQRILDLCNPEVTDFLIRKMSEVFASANIRYVKWDMNRIFSDVYSPYLPKSRQGEASHRYILGLYRIMRALTERFPQILFEGCASGGNRFDLGVLSYFPQIWASDNTDALCRASIQEGYSYGYPQSCIGAHVSASPNHQTLRTTPLESRYNIAAFGLLGYELDMKDMSKADKEHMKAQILLYTVWREVFQMGQFYRVRSGNVHEWTVVSADKTQAVGMIFQELTTPNAQAEICRPQGLDPDKTYRMYNVSGRVNVKLFGSLINTMSPIHIKQDSLIHNIIARTYHMGQEKEEFVAKGSVLMRAGARLSPAYGGTGFSENVRLFPDFASRMYFITQEDESEPPQNTP